MSAGAAQVGPVEVGLPLPDGTGSLWRLRVDGPLALPSTYRAPDSQLSWDLHLEHLSQVGGLTGCLACGQPELYTRKRFPRAAGIVIVVAAAIFAPFTHYLSLVVAAVLDWLLFQFSPEEMVCYACEAEHFGFPDEPRHPHFDRTIAERLSYGEKAVMGSPMRPGGTAGAPEPHH